jgi:hypothetical protein
MSKKIVILVKEGLKHFHVKLSYVRFHVLKAVSTKMAVFWVVAPCSLVEVYQRFRRTYCLHHQGDRPVDGGKRR